MMGELQCLSNKEIEEFLDDIDRNSDDYIEFDELEHKLDEVHEELVPTPKPHNLNHENRDDEERHAFFRSIIKTDKNRIPRAEFAEIVRGWKIPSLKQEKEDEDKAKHYVNGIPWGRRFRAWWSVDGPETLFLCLVVAMQIAFGTWQLVKYLTETQYRHAFGWGIVLAKTSAGVLYPTWFFLVLSMSRYFSTFMRRFKHISRFINWDLSQSFHIKMSCAALCFATLHAIGHLTGSFLYGSRPAQEQAVAAVLGPEAVPRPYIDYVRSLPGWSGITALGLFYLLAILSAPIVRRWSYEVFQLGHLLMFPIIGLLCAHGTAQLFQFAMLGYWLAFPTLLVLLERSIRVVLSFQRITASMEILDDDTIAINVKVPECRHWPYKAGQYILLQVPQVSLFQWHPFTISTCIENEMQVHIKTDGDWTRAVRELGEDLKYVGIDGPFGAPAQRFYDFDQSIIVGSGIGVTPFSGILTDLQVREDRSWREGGKSSRSRSRGGRSLSRASRSIRRLSIASSRTATQNDAAYINSSISLDSPGVKVVREERHQSNSYKAGALKHHKRVDFHWIVKDRNYLLWFSDLLNELSCLDTRRGLPEHSPYLDVRLTTHVTQKRRQISQHVFRWLLESHRTEKHPASPLTGLINRTHFGRPDLGKIMNDHYESMVEMMGQEMREGDKTGGEGRGRGGKKGIKVGVFFCGTPIIGYELADRCQLLTLRGREDGNQIEYHFMMEVFG